MKCSDWFMRTWIGSYKLWLEVRKEITMPDWEEMILARQDEQEILEDECSGDCDYCPWHRYIPDTMFRIDREPVVTCGLFDED